jgi:hypothetical protein
MMKLRKLLSLVAICATAAIFTGCGDDDNDAPGGANSNAPEMLNGKTYTLTDAGTGGTIAFDAAANNYTLNEGGNIETGSFIANRSGETWTVDTTDSLGTTTSTLTLTFTGAGSGTYTYRRPGQDPEVVTGSFALASGGTTTSTGTSTSTGTDTGTSTSTGTDTGTSTSTGTDTGTSTSTGTDTGTSTSTGTDTGTSTSTGTTTGVGTVPAPATLTSITVRTEEGAIGANAVYTVTLNGGASGTFNAVNTGGEDMGSGTFTYTPSGNQANLRLVYPAFDNDYDDMTLFFTQQPGSGLPNPYTGSQKAGPEVKTMKGTFTY